MNHSSNTGWQFLSTPSARRATTEAPEATETKEYFYPRPLRGGRPVKLLLALHVALFLSTPSARRATDLYRFIADFCMISIHALCEEGDAARSRP